MERRPARPPAPHRRPDRGHGRRPARRRRAARPGRRGARRLAAPQRAAIERRPGAARRGRDHLREPAQRHQRRRRHLPEVGQRRAPARLGHRAAVEPGDRRGAARRRSPRPGSPPTCVLLVDDVRHEAAVELMQLTDVVDCLIPRGGPALIQSIRDHATVPVIIDGDGNCHVYVDASADLDTRARHRGERQDQPPERVQRGRVARRARGGGRRVPARACATALVEQGVELVGDAGARAACAGDGRGDRRRLRDASSSR